MNSPDLTINRRVLIIDDNEAIHSDFRKILEQDNQMDDLDQAEEAIFGKQSDREAPLPFYMVDSAYQGRSGMTMAKEARKRGKPYAMAFVDMRMPPGWDGVETIENLWKVDPDIEVVICTAYTDHPWSQIYKRFGNNHRLLILKKPFDYSEVSQLVIALTTKWQLEKQAKQETQKLGHEVQERGEALTQQIAKHKSLQLAVAAMERVLGVVGHELRTPLAALRITTEFLLTDEAQQLNESNNFLTNIHQEVVSMSEMVNNLLEAARLNSGCTKWSWTQVKLSEACEEMMRVARPLLPGAGVDFKCNIDPPDLTLNGDAEAIRRLLINFISNSAKHTNSGHISIDIHAFNNDAGNWVEIVIDDTGDGIPDAIVGKLGQAFVLNAGLVGSDYVNGAGLGLSICRGIIAAHGGSITVKSQLGEGSTFTVTLKSDLHGPITTGDETQITREEAA